jgi:hypothetical protein
MTLRISTPKRVWQGHKPTPNSKRKTLQAFAKSKRGKDKP